MTISYSKQVLLKRGNTAVASTYIGPLGEMVLDTDTMNVYVHDGVTAGGVAIVSNSGYADADVKTYLGAFDGNIIPSANVTYSLGSITHQWKDLFVSNNTIYINGIPLSLGADNNTLSINGQPLLSNASVSSITTEGDITANAFITTDGTNLYDVIAAGVNTGRFVFDSSAVSAELLTVSSSNDIWIQGGPKNREDVYPDLYLFLNGTDGNGTGGAEIDIKNDGLTLWSKYGSGSAPQVKWTFDQTGKLTLADGTNIYNDGGALRVDATDKIQLSVYTGPTAQTVTLDTDGTVTLPAHVDVLGELSVNGDTTLSNTTINGTFVLNGDTQYIVTENALYTDSILEIHAHEGGIDGTWGSNDGKDIGLRMHYYDNGTDKNAALFMDNGDWRLKWVTDAVEVGGQINHTGFGDIQAGNYYGNIATASQPNITLVGTLTNLTVTNSITGNISGNAGTATKLQTARAINGVNFDGSAAITVTANAATLTGTTLNSTVLASSLTSVGTLGSLTVSGNVALQGLTQIQQLDTPYTAKTNATGTVTHDCSVGQDFYHTSISGNFTPNFTNLGTVTGFITKVALYLVQGSTARSVTAMQIAGSSKTINWFNGVNPTFTTNAVNIVTFTILLSGTTYTVFGKVEEYDTVGGGGGG